MKAFSFTLAAYALAGSRVFAGTEMAPDPKQMRVSTSLRSDSGFYVAASGGANFDTDYGNHAQTLSGDVRGSTVASHKEISSNDWGGVGGVKAGYNFDSFAI